MSHPNILIMVCHDLGRFLGCYSVPTVQTPHIDRLAGQGIRFTRAFCTAPQCSSSRASMYTGRYPHSNGVLGLTHGNFGWDLHPEERHLGQILRDSGYTTALLGIHHESRRLSPEEVAARCGMDVLLPPATGERLSQQAAALIEQRARGDQPFYLQIGFEEPHRLYAADEPDYEGFIGDYIQPDSSQGITIPGYLRNTPGGRAELAELQGAIRYVDRAIGQILGALDRLGLAENTIVVLTTDHGLALPRAKCTLYDPGIEAALIMRYPRRGWQAGSTRDALISNVDLLPTLLDLAGIMTHERVQGRSFAPLLDGAAYESRDAIFSEMTYHDYYDPQRCIRTDRYKLIAFFAAAPAFMDPTQSWRPRSDPVVPEQPALAFHPLIELYDLDADPWERHNLAGDPAYAAVRRDLAARLMAWMRDTGDPLLAGAVTSPTHWMALAALTDSSG
jgi:N-sulfoglucosamine sulfohydrolase